MDLILPCAADVLSAVEFGPTGEYLATGDKGGRVVVFKQSARSPELAKAQGKVAYSFYTEFQSHEPEFDYLKSLESHAFGSRSAT